MLRTGRGSAGGPIRSGEGVAPLGGPFRLFQSAVVSSDLADGVYKIAVPLLALHLTRSPAAVSLVGLAVRLPWLVTTLPAGVLADRWPARTVMRWASAVRLPLVSAVCWLAAVGALPLWLLVVAAFLIGSAGNVVDVAAQTLLPRLVDREQLPRANAALQSTQVFLAQLLAPAIGGYVAALGSAGGLAVATALYLATLWTLGLVPAAAGTAAPAPTAPRTPVSLRSLTAELAEGLAYFRRRGDLARLAATAAVNNLCYAMCLTMLPLWAVAPGPLGLTGGGYGLLLTSLAVGSIAGGRIAGPVVRRIGEKPLLRFGGPLLGLCFLALALPSVPVAAAAMVGYGLVSMIWNVVVVSYRQSTIPAELFGRVNAAYRQVTWGVIPLGALVAGALAAWAGTVWVFVVAGVLPPVAAVLAPVHRRASAEQPLPVHD